MPFRAVLVDDDADGRLLVRLTLEGSGSFEVVGEAADAGAGVAVARDASPDVILLDLTMPGTDGLAALPLLAEAAPAAKVVVFSGLAAADVAAAAVAGGAVGFVQKTMSFRHLADEVLAVSGLLELVAAAVAEARAHLAAEPQSAGAARRFVDQTLARWDCAEVFDLVSLLVSEVVTNAVVHASSPVEVAVRLLPAAVRIEVADRSTEVPRLRRAVDDETGGRGLALVAALAQSWGVDLHPAGKTVWFELPRPPARAAPVAPAGPAVPVATAPAGPVWPRRTEG